MVFLGKASWFLCKKTNQAVKKDALGQFKKGHAVWKNCEIHVQIAAVMVGQW